MVKKTLKIIGIISIVFIAILIAIPFLFGGTITDKIKYLANQHLKATVDFTDVDISLLRSFPKASVVIDDFSIINQAPFEGDTLAYVKRIALDMGITEIFKGADDPITIKRIRVDEAAIAVKTDSLGNTNTDITKSDTSTSSETTDSDSEESSSFTFALEHYEINDSKVLYSDDTSKMVFTLTDLNHSGDGTFSGDHILLDTHSSTAASLNLENTNYLNNHLFKLDAILDLDLANQRYTFKDNKALINQLPLEFSGFVQLAEKYTDVDILFETPTSDFKNLLAVIPETYSKNLDGVQTAGNFGIKGIVKGKVDDTHIPTMDIQITADKASFKYPDLPKAVDHIAIDTKIMNTTGLVDDTFVTINNLSFNIDKDTFNARGKLEHLTKNMLVALHADGVLNLGNLDKAYPIELDQDINGILKADITTKFDMESLEKEQYQNITTIGTASLHDFTYTSPELPNPINIADAAINCQPATITLDHIKVTTGKSDLSANGAIHNLMGFLFSKQDLKGDFSVNSDVFAVDDFMVATTETEETDTEAETTTKESETTEEALKIPSFIDATLAFNAKKVVYDNLELQNTKGTVQIKDETAYLKNVSSELFDGSLAFDGNVSTKPKTPTFAMDVDLKNINIAQSFTKLSLLQKLAPIAQALTGTLTTKMKLNGDLSESLLPIPASLKGNALANILNAKVSATQTPLLSQLDSKASFLKLDKLKLNDIKTALTFDDGKINVQPFDIKVNDVTVTAQGSHGFDMNMDYKLAVDVPAKYLDNKLGDLLTSQLGSANQNTRIAIPIGITGNFSQPAIKLNTKDAVSQLTKQLANQQKEKAKEKLVGESNKVLSNLLGGKKEDQNTKETNQTNTAEGKIKDAAKNILGGFLGKKKKKDDNKN